MAMEYEAEIHQFVTDIGSTFLNREISPTDKPFKPKGKNNTLAGCVQITGNWQGTITVYAPKEIGKMVASTIYGLDESEVDDQQIQDVIGEITNILAGNIKSLFPPICSLSLPSVSITDYDLHHPESQPSTAVNFECEGMAFLVIMHQENAK
jgi:chemotaxis protein CheX